MGSGQRESRSHLRPCSTAVASENQPLFLCFSAQKGESAGSLCQQKGKDERKTALGNQIPYLYAYARIPSHPPPPPRPRSLSPKRQIPATSQFAQTKARNRQIFAPVIDIYFPHHNNKTRGASRINSRNPAFLPFCSHLINSTSASFAPKHNATRISNNFLSPSINNKTMAGGKGKSSGGKSSGGKTSVDGPKKQQSHSARAGLQVRMIVRYFGCFYGLCAGIVAFDDFGASCRVLCCAYLRRISPPLCHRCFYDANDIGEAL